MAHRLSLHSAKSLLQGILISLISGIGVGLVRDRLDHVFRQPGEVKEDLGLPLLGHIPHVDFFKGVREDKRFLLQELDRSVGTAIAIKTTKRTRVHANKSGTNASSIKKPFATCTPRCASSTATAL